jgi:hypothetical protein
MIKNTVCYSSMPITVQAGLRVRKLALHSNRSYCYAFRFRAALTNTNPAPASVILVRNAGLAIAFDLQDAVIVRSSSELCDS